ncbi:acetyltransferase [Xenorhabdus nematophila]|uniref:acetyltransferase n=1 Tax=Xenorhabdus nematophila TaxID=628 RepID=UPI000541C749|nr:acetyltransferase [Xenorhabdus nematophila]CEE92152.1 Acetyltransferase, GNAT family [Xenorhabdus nematophila str. Anatoliense]CEF30598.1 Acetyltransferase, GNAT family [Xenorhabdus nematophila str. Websteri]AYA40996.1 acetyltransferase [Xenorhabdus nematophila]MBA0019742.1 acetyltransferase [Xenorhabdus nematophila]MCB4425108.1 acetyltransferase [Xenorhabdus nematophila]
MRFEQADVTRTYLILDKSGSIIAYFSLTFKELSVHDFSISKTKIKKFSGISKSNNTIKVYLIGQIAKNFSLHKNPIQLKDIFLYARNIINISKSLIGGRVIALECENNHQLIELYIKHGFEKLPTKGEKSLLIIMLFNN